MPARLQGGFRITLGKRGLNMLDGALFSAERVICAHFRTGLGERAFLRSIGAWILTGYLILGHFCFGLGDNGLPIKVVICDKITSFVA